MRMPVLFVVLLAFPSRLSGGEAPKELTSQIMKAAHTNDVARLKTLLNAHPSLANAKGSGNWTPLHHAAFHGHKDAVLVLLAYGADIRARATAIKAINGISAKNETAQQFAAKTRKKHIAQLLSEIGAMSVEERNGFLSPYRDKVKKAGSRHPSSVLEEERETIKKYKALLADVLAVDGEEIRAALAKIHLNPIGNTLGDKVRSVRERIPAKAKPFLAKWKPEDHALFFDVLEKGISGSNGHIQNRIGRKIVGKAIAAVADKYRSLIAAAEGRVAEAEKGVTAPKAGTEGSEERKKGPNVTIRNLAKYRSVKRAPTGQATKELQAFVDRRLFWETEVNNIVPHKKELEWFWVVCADHAHNWRDVVVLLPVPAKEVKRYYKGQGITGYSGDTTLQLVRALLPFRSSAFSRSQIN